MTTLDYGRKRPECGKRGRQSETKMIFIILFYDFSLEEGNFADITFSGDKQKSQRACVCVYDISRKSGGIKKYVLNKLEML